MKKKPSMLDMVKNFAKEVKNYAKEGAPNVSQGAYIDRLSACDACEHLKRQSMRCGLCGCLVEQKAKWATSDCPDKRWPRQKVGSQGKPVSLKGQQVIQKRKERRNGSQDNSTKTGD